MIGYKNLPLLFSHCGWLEEKNRPNQILSFVGYNEQRSGELHITFCTFFFLKYTN